MSFTVILSVSFVVRLFVFSTCANTRSDADAHACVVPAGDSRCVSGRADTQTQSDGFSQNRAGQQNVVKLIKRPRAASNAPAPKVLLIKCNCLRIQMQ